MYCRRYLLLLAGLLGCSGTVSIGGSGGVLGGTGGSGQNGSGGSIGTGGTIGRGGAMGTGGATGTGGAIGTGGSGARGGGGMSASGGAIGAGGSPATGGASALTAGYFVGADITFIQADEASGATFSDGTRKEILQLLKDHGFNYIRLRTFVDPRAADGYDKQNGYADLAHTITFGKRIKAAGMGFLLDFHYSDNWADPGKQCVPIAWQSLTTIAALATAVHDYTRDAISQLVAAGARPDMVQIGNEITPGMLIHRCDSGGLPTGNNPVTGSSSNWTNLGMLLKAGVAGVKEVDPSIKIMLHIDRGGDKPADAPGSALRTSVNFINNARTQGVAFDVFGESCYQLFQGDPANATSTKTGWTNTFTQLATMFPTLRFVAAEYGPLQREINDVVFGVPGQLGIGTFNWEPSHNTQGSAGHALFTRAGSAYTATPDLALYDTMKTAYASRL